ncbi:uncharacterized protein BKA55DRAFT_589223 [Fusarium redolens]|uniref:Cyanovirin-N domain-containing protein n=1 Tax=Fusarium redolens TaxID=48865 RepID=A0A9P9KYG0_FUSRE|nr:uncharacterized protein BKA55DRAFT_589223 [Fusarium redolens]KAH7270872.1 hypothetical protein BKA55DRAFT_589223 [Fusarium redolens]
MTKAITVLMTLLCTAFAQIDRTCIDIAFNSETNTLSGKCQPRDNSGYIPSELDLNDCFGYDGTNITPTYHGNFAESCHGCEMFVAPDPWYGGAEYWIRCTCKGQSGKVAVPLEAAVAHEYTFSAREFKGLCLLSPYLSKLYLRFHYFGNNNGAFRDALRNADIKVMERCAQLGAAPDTRWELPEADGCRCLSERRHTHHRPIDELLESVYLGEAPIDKSVDALKWLLGRKFDMTEQRDQPWYDANDYCDHVPEFLITILNKSPDRVRTEGICQMIKLLHSYDYSLPFHMNFASYLGRDWEDIGLPGPLSGPLDVALRSHCPPYLLELALRDYMRRLVEFGVAYLGGSPLMQSEAADVLEQKIEVLIKYQVLNQLEETMLRGIVESMRSMTTPTKASNFGVVDDGDSLCCWETLYSAILPFKTIEEHWILDDWDLIDPTISCCLPHECHRFNIDPDCNVYKMYHDYQMQNDQIRPTLNRPWGSEGVVKREDGKWVHRERSRLFHSNDYTGLGMVGMVGGDFSRLPSWTEGCSYADIEKAVLAPLPEDYETAKALLDEPEPEYHLSHSGAACSRGKVGPHNVVLVGKAEDMLNVSTFVKDTVDDVLEAFPSIRTGFLIGIDGTAPEESLAKPGDIVVGFPQGFQPGLVQFDVDETTISNRISTTFEMSHPPSCIKSVFNTIQSPEGRRHWGEYLQHQSSRAELASTKDCQPLKQDPSKPNKILRGIVASSARLLSDRDLTNKVGSDSKIMCFERAAAKWPQSYMPCLSRIESVLSNSKKNMPLQLYFNTIDLIWTVLDFDWYALKKAFNLN